MKLISFDAFRTLGLDVHGHIKPEHMFHHLLRIREADWVLFPEYWQINVLVFGLKKRVFPSLATYLIGHDKIEMIRAFRAVAADHTPQTLIGRNEPVTADDIWQRMDLPFVAKIPRSSMGQGVFLIETASQWRQYLSSTQVIYVQEYLPIDRDLRIVVAGERVLGGFWRVQAAQGFYNNLSRGGLLEKGPLPAAALAVVSRVCRDLGINYAGFDVAMVDGRPYLLEFNRLFGNFSLNLFRAEIGEAILACLQTQSDLNDPNTPEHHPPQLPNAA